MEGIIIVNKPADWTSFDVVAKIRNLSGEKKVGHSGTLDPMAVGVLPVFLGKATKSIDNFMLGNKGYFAEITFGIKTDTLDQTGKILHKSKVDLSVDDIAQLLDRFRGEIKQIPPMHSAIKVKGKRLYHFARKGIAIKREPREVTIHKLELLNFETADYPKATLDVICSKGTYIRKLASDIGDELGCGAHLSKLIRTYAHPFHIAQAINMDTIITLAKVGKLETILVPVEGVLNG